MPEQLTQYVVRIPTTKNEPIPVGYQFIEYRGEHYGVQPKRGCEFCHGSGIVTRNGEESKCDCLWRRMFDARRQAPKPSARVFVSDAPGMVDQLQKRRVMLQKQVTEARQAFDATQCNRDEALIKHDQKTEEQQEVTARCEEQFQAVHTEIAHLEKSIEYNTGRADELRAQARELENQVARDKVTLSNTRSNTLHQISVERERALKKKAQLDEQRTKLLHDWSRNLRDPQKDLRRAEERLGRLDQQLRRISIEDEPNSDAVELTAEDPALVNINPVTGEPVLDSLAILPAGELPTTEATPLAILAGAPTAPLTVPPPVVQLTTQSEHDACRARGIPCSTGCPAGLPQPSSTATE
jgi:hypothetical protein